MGGNTIPERVASLETAMTFIQPDGAQIKEDLAKVLANQLEQKTERRTYVRVGAVVGGGISAACSSAFALAVWAHSHGYIRFSL